MRKAVGAVFALMVSVAASAADFSSLEERMSQAEFHAAGLDRLSPEELKTLNEWLRTHNSVTTTMITPAGKPVFYPTDSGRDQIEDHIDGKFAGWHGRSVFKLENGQEWTQAESGSSACTTTDHPWVKIKPMMLGSWLMYVEGCSDSVRVTRTK